MGPPSTVEIVNMWRQHSLSLSIGLNPCGEIMWVKGFFPFSPFRFSKFRFFVFPRATARKKSQKNARNRNEENHEGGRRDKGISAQRTIQCESFGNPDTAAGPKARAVFIAAPVYGTANLKIHSVRRGS
jgi:hypothetical protein